MCLPMRNIDAKVCAKLALYAHLLSLVKQIGQPVDTSANRLIVHREGAHNHFFGDARHRSDAHTGIGGRTPCPRPRQRLGERHEHHLRSQHFLRYRLWRLLAVKCQHRDFDFFNIGLQL